jgi:hypothetical protein
VSANRFLVMAIAQISAGLNTAAFFEERKSRADLAAFRRIMARQGGEPSMPRDELPE